MTRDDVSQAIFGSFDGVVSVIPRRRRHRPRQLADRHGVGLGGGLRPPSDGRRAPAAARASLLPLEPGLRGHSRRSEG